MAAANPSYFRQLDEQLVRPAGELVRCRCEQRFVCIPRVARSQQSQHLGRRYAGCPLYVAGGAPGGGGGGRRQGCSFWQPRD